MTHAATALRPTPPLFSLRPCAPLQGVISVTSNLVPSLMSSLMAAPDAATAASLHDLMGWLFCEPNPIPL